MASGDLHDVSIRVRVPKRNPATGFPYTERDVRAAIWRRVHGGALTTFTILAIDWRKGARAYHYGDEPDVWASLRPIFRTIGWSAFRVELVSK